MDLSFPSFIILLQLLSFLRCPVLYNPLLHSYINFVSFNKEMGEGTGAIISLKILPMPLKLATTKWYNSESLALLGCYAA